MIVYKLTDKDGKTRVGFENETQWGNNVTNETDGSGELCGSGWLHAYEDPLLAVLHNPIHARLNPDTMILWECKTGDVIKRDGFMKLGTTKLTTVKQIPLPVITIEQRSKYAVLCALSVYKEKDFVIWANKWLYIIDKTKAAAETVAWVTAEVVAWAVAEAITPINLISIAKQAML